MIKVSWDQPYSDQSELRLYLLVLCLAGVFLELNTASATQLRLSRRRSKSAWMPPPRTCLQGAASTKWTAVLDQFPVATCTNITFKEAQKAYLEKIADVSNLRDMLIHQLRNNGKPTYMRFNTFVACHQEWVCHLDSGYLNITIARLTNQENMEAILSHQPKCHQAKYALKKEEVKNAPEKL
eukprot:8999837-Ditylum_brightwellii.AAC.1